MVLAGSSFSPKKGGKITAALIGVGGFLGIGEKNVAVPFTAIKVAQNRRCLVLETSKEALQTAPDIHSIGLRKCGCRPLSKDKHAGGPHSGKSI